jgi:C4-type Zn-finger protein
MSEMVKDESADACMELSKRKMSSRNNSGVSFTTFLSSPFADSFINLKITVRDSETSSE